jgi:hypothetical protein
VLKSIVGLLLGQVEHNGLALALRKGTQQIRARDRAGGGGQARHVIADQTDHGQRGRPFGPAGDREPVPTVFRTSCAR